LYPFTEPHQGHGGLLCAAHETLFGTALWPAH